MTQTARRARPRILLVIGVSLVVLGAMPALAQASASWQSGPLVESQDNNCITGDPEYEAGTYLSYYADPASPPQVGQVYYVAIDATGIGNTCPGIYADINLIMPSGTAPAISSQFPVRCYLQFPGHNNYVQDTGSECPQSLPVGLHGYSLDPHGVNPPFWPLPQGASVEIQVPVISTQPLNGTSQLHGYVQLADGESDPTLAPSLVVIVNPQSTPVAQQIGILYSNPAITSQTTNGNGTVNANFTSYIENYGNPGTAHAELAKADTAGDCTTPGLFNPTIVSNNANLQNPQTQITGTWTTLYPGGAYCFRLVATVSSGPSAGTYYGNWQYFATQGAFFSNPAPSQYLPPQAHPLTGTACSANGSGCSTSNCNAGSTCTGGGSLGTFSGGKTTTDKTLTVAVAGTAGGTVSGTGGISCPGSCSKTYTSGTAVSLAATPAAGSTFTGWSGACSGTGTCALTMSSDQQVTATFAPAPNPPPPAPPSPSPVAAKCTLSSGGSSVLLKAHRHSQRSSVGILLFHVRCDQAANATLTAVLTETLGARHRKLQTKTFRLSGARKSVAAGVSTAFSLALPRAALAGLAQHKHEQLVATLEAGNANGVASATANVAKLRGTG